MNNKTYLSYVFHLWAKSQLAFPVYNISSMWQTSNTRRTKNFSEHLRNPHFSRGLDNLISPNLNSTDRVTSLTSSISRFHTPSWTQNWNIFKEHTKQMNYIVTHDEVYIVENVIKDAWEITRKQSVGKITLHTSNYCYEFRQRNCKHECSICSLQICIVSLHFNCPTVLPYINIFHSFGYITKTIKQMRIILKYDVYTNSNVMLVNDTHNYFT